ncbi:unnamed protein product [Closterium sp. Naga37s-1]|nr:unnamed protein product [Closterium sp. Naga37s-1]
MRGWCRLRVRYFYQRLLSSVSRVQVRYPTATHGIAASSSSDERQTIPFETLETPFEALETPFEALETPFEALGTPFEALGTPFEALEMLFPRYAERGVAERGGKERGAEERGGEERGEMERGGEERGGKERGGKERVGEERSGKERGGEERGVAERGGKEREKRGAERRGAERRGAERRGEQRRGRRGEGRKGEGRKGERRRGEEGRRGEGREARRHRNERGWGGWGRSSWVQRDCSDQHSPVAPIPCPLAMPFRARMHVMLAATAFSPLRHVSASSLALRGQEMSALEMSALVRVFNGYGERSSTNLTYWGLAGCADNRSMELYNAATMGMSDLTTGTLIMLVEDADRPVVERITGRPIVTLLGLPASRKALYIVNVLGGIDPADPILPFTDFSASVHPSVLPSLLLGTPGSSPPIFFGKHRVGTVMMVPIRRHPVPPDATAEQLRESVSTVWAGFYFLQEEMTNLLALLHNGTGPPYSLALYDTTDPAQPIQVLGPEPLRVENGSFYPYVLPGPVMPYPKHVEPFPEDLLGRKYEAHCRFEGAYPKWELVYAPMLLGLLVLLVALLLSAVIAVLAWKQQQMAEAVSEIQLCTAALEKAERSKSETVANTSHELRTPIIGMIGMIEELLESQLEEWQVADLRVARACMIEELLDSSLEEWQVADLQVARACAGETVELINRVLDLAKLQAGRLQLETLPCCLRRIVHEATALAASDAQTKESHVTCHVDESVPAVLMGDPTRLSQVIGELTAHAIGNTTGGHVTFHVCCIPPPPPHPASINCFNLHGPSTSAAPVHALPGSPASQPPSYPPGYPAAPGGYSAWHQLAACVRRFPPPTALACLPQTQGGRAGGGGESGAGDEQRRMGCVERCCRRVAAATGMGAAGMGTTGMGAAGMGGPCIGDSIELNERGGGEALGGAERLEEEVRKWVEEACAAREEGEWMVVVACEDMGGGIPPEEMRWVLDPHGDSHHAAHTSHALPASAAADGDAGQFLSLPSHAPHQQATIHSHRSHARAEGSCSPTLDAL